MRGKRLKYLRNGFTMLEMTWKNLKKRVIYVGNDVYMLEMAYVFEKGLKYVGNVGDLWEVAQLCGEIAQLFDKRLKSVENESEIFEMTKIYGKWFRYMGHGLRI